MRRYFWLGAAAALSWGASAFAQATPVPDPVAPQSADPSLDISSIDLEDLLDTPIESVSRREEKSSLAPATVFVVSQDDIRKQGFHTLADVLRSMPGFFISDDAAYPVAGIRGFSTPGDLTTRILILVDGHPLNNSVGIGQSYIARDFPVNARGIERVEVIKGPVGSVYGPLAYFGVVNVVTRRAEGEGHSAEVAVGGELAQGAPNGGEVEALYSGAAGGASWVINLGLYRSNGFTWEFPELVGLDRDLPEGGVVRDADRRWANNTYASIRYSDLTLTLGWSQRWKNLPASPYSVVIGDPRNNFYNRTGFAQLTWARKLTEQFELYARAGYDDFRYTDDLVYPPPPDDAGMFYDLGVDRWGTAEVRGTLTPLEGHRDMLGVEVQYHDTNQRSQYRDLPNALEDPVDGFGVGDLANRFVTLNAYLLVEQRLLEDRLLLQGGLTFYVHQLFGNRLTPKLAAVFQATPDDTLKGYYSEGFRPPMVFEAVFEDGLDFIPNGGLRPETVRTAELSYERRLGGVATVGLSLYHSRYASLIRSTTVPNPDLDGVPPDPENPDDFRQQFQNGGEASATGMDLHFNLRLRRTLRAYGGVAVQFADYGTDDPAERARAAANFAPVTANAALSSNGLWEPLSLALNAAFVAGRSKDPDTILIPTDRDSVDPYLLLNATARLEFPWVKGLGAQLSVYNLLDWRYADPVVGDLVPLSEVRNPGRSFRVDMEYRF